MESNDDTYESEKEYEKNMYASGNAEDYMNEVEDEEEWNRVQADSSVKVDEAGERTGGKKFGLRDRYRVACACAYIIFFIPLILTRRTMPAGFMRAKVRWFTLSRSWHGLQGHYYPLWA